MDSRFHLPQDSLEACFRFQLRSLRMIPPSPVVAMLELCQYWDSIYNSYRMNHAPASYLSQFRPRNSWNTHQEQPYLNVLDHAARNSYPGENSTMIPPHATPYLNPQATHHQDMDYDMLTDEWVDDYLNHVIHHDDAGEFENSDWSSDDDEETATNHDSLVDANISRNEDIDKYLKTRRRRKEDVVESNICVVCQDGLCEKDNDEDEAIATMNCGHEYHIHCIKRWLLRKNVCPLCNVVVLPQY